MGILLRRREKFYTCKEMHFTTTISKILYLYVDNYLAKILVSLVVSDWKYFIWCKIRKSPDTWDYHWGKIAHFTLSSIDIYSKLIFLWARKITMNSFGQTWKFFSE